MTRRGRSFGYLRVRHNGGMNAEELAMREDFGGIADLIVVDTPLNNNGAITEILRVAKREDAVYFLSISDLSGNCDGAVKALSILYDEGVSVHILDRTIDGAPRTKVAWIEMSPNTFNVLKSLTETGGLPYEARMGRPKRVSDDDLAAAVAKHGGIGPEVNEALGLCRAQFLRRVRRLS